MFISLEETGVQNYALAETLCGLGGPSYVHKQMQASLLLMLTMSKQSTEQHQGLHKLHMPKSPLLLLSMAACG